MEGLEKTPALLWHSVALVFENEELPRICKLLACEKSILQKLWRCGGSGGVRIEWGMW